MSNPLFSPRRSVTVLVATIVGLTLLVSSCGSDSSQNTSVTPPLSETFRIGLEAPLTGSQSAVGEGMLRGAQLAATELNETGGILGKEVQIVPIDDKADPAAGEEAAKAAIAEGLDAVVGPYNSGAGAKTLPLYIDAGLVPLRLTSADSTAGLGFTLQPMTSQIAPTAVTAITTWAGAKSVGIIYDSTQDYTKQATEAMQQLLPPAGVTITSSEAITPGATSYTDALNTVLANGPDLIYVVAYYPEAAAIAKDVVASGTSASCLIDYGGFDSGYITAAGVPAAQRCPVVGVPAPDDFPNAARDIEEYLELFGDAPGTWSPYTYDSVRLLADAIARAGGADAEKLTAALSATSGWQGWTGTVAFDPATGNREPDPVTIMSVDASGAFHVDTAWATAVSFGF